MGCCREGYGGGGGRASEDATWLSCVSVSVFNYFFWLHWVSVALVCAFLSCGEQGLLFIAVCGLIVLASLLWSAGSAVVGPSCSAACGIFLGRGGTVSPYPLHHQGSPPTGFCVARVLMQRLLGCCESLRIFQTFEKVVSA